MPTCFERVGMDVPAAGGDCLCGEFVQFHLAHRRIEHFLVCPVVDEIVNERGVPDDIDEAAVKVGMDAYDQDRGAEGAVQEPEAAV